MWGSTWKTLSLHKDRMCTHTLSPHAVCHNTPLPSRARFNTLATGVASMQEDIVTNRSQMSQTESQRDQLFALFSHSPRRFCVMLLPPNPCLRVWRVGRKRIRQQGFPTHPPLAKGNGWIWWDMQLVTCCEMENISNNKWTKCFNKASYFHKRKPSFTIRIYFFPISNIFVYLICNSSTTEWSCRECWLCRSG